MPLHEVKPLWYIVTSFHWLQKPFTWSKMAAKWDILDHHHHHRYHHHHQCLITQFPLSPIAFGMRSLVLDYLCVCCPTQWHETEREGERNRMKETESDIDSLNKECLHYVYMSICLYLWNELYLHVIVAAIQ